LITPQNKTPDHRGVTLRVVIESPNHSSLRTRCGLVALDLGGLLDLVVDLSERLLGAQQLVVLEESTSILAESVERVREIVLPSVLGELDVLDDTGVDEALQVLADRRLTPAWIDLVQLLQRRQPRRMP
jgi:hypothetical protein